MYPVSEKYLEAMKSRSRFEYCRGTIDIGYDPIPFTDKNVLNMNYTNRCSDTADATFGSCFIGQLKADFFNINVPAGDWRRAVITVEVGLLVDEEEEEIEWVPLGVFNVASAEWKDNYVSILANDNIIKLDKNAVGIELSGGTVYDIAYYCCLQCGVTLANTEEEIKSWTNGTYDLEWNSSNDVSTFRDIMGYVSACVAGFVTADRDGKIKIARLATSRTQYVDILYKKDRIIGSSFSDFETVYAGVRIIRKSEKYKKEVMVYYTANNVPEQYKSDEFYIDMGNNPFLSILYPKNPWMLNTILQNIASRAYSYLSMTPYTVSTLSNIIYDLSDILMMREAIPGVPITYARIMQIDWTLKETTEFQGFGSDPTLKLGKTAAEKAATGSSSASAMNEMTYISYQNSDLIEVGEDPVEVSFLNFVAKEATSVDIWHEFHLVEVAPIDPNEPIEAVLWYYLDGELVAFFPRETWNVGETHILGTNYFINGVGKNEQHTWRVTLHLINGRGYIDIGEGRTLLRGQRLEGNESSDNFIQASDYIGRYSVKTLSAEEFSDAVQFIQQTIVKAEGSDMVNRQNFEELSTRELTDSVNIRMRLVNDWIWMSGQAYSGDTIDDTLF